MDSTKTIDCGMELPERLIESLFYLFYENYCKMTR